jgi:hypothetical protein
VTVHGRTHFDSLIPHHNQDSTGVTGSIYDHFFSAWIRFAVNDDRPRFNPLSSLIHFLPLIVRAGHSRVNPTPQHWATKVKPSILCGSADCDDAYRGEFLIGFEWHQIVSWQQ